MSDKTFVAVHIGAGRHSRNISYETEMKKLCDKACTISISYLKQGYSSTEAAVLAVKVLEDHPWTNAGFGSNLNKCGLVECDAAIMDGGTGLFACVGAVPSNSHYFSCLHNSFTINGRQKSN